MKRSSAAPENPFLTPGDTWPGKRGFLDRLGALLARDRRVAMTQEETGGGGMGKSRLVRDYIQESGGGARWTWWIRGGDPIAGFLDGLALADYLRVPPRKTDLLRLRALRERLAREEGGLLVLDGVPSPKEAENYLPPPGKGCQIIVISAWRFWGGTPFTPLVAPAWSHDNHPPLPPLPDAGSADGGKIELFAELRGAPLALNMAAAILRDTGVRPAALATHLRNKREAREGAVDRRLGRSRAVIELGLKRLAQRVPPAFSLVQFLALFSNVWISTTTVKQLLSSVPAERAPTHWDAGLSPQRDPEALLTAAAYFACLEWDDRWVALHPLVRTVVLETLNPKRQAFFSRAALSWASKTLKAREENASAPTPDNHWVDVVVGSALMTTEKARRERAAQVISRLGQWAQSRGWVKIAEASCRRGLAWAERDGEDNPEIARFANALGSALQEQGNLIDARDCFKRALELGRTLLGDRHPVVHASANNLGLTQQALGDLTRARDSLELALSLTEKQHGPMHVSYGATADNLGCVLREMGDLQGAFNWFQLSLGVGERTLGPTHPTMAVRFNNLGGVQKRMGDLRGAVHCQNQALAILEERLGPGHPQTAAMANNLGRTLCDLGDYVRARELLEQALTIAIGLHGEGHPATATIHNNLGLVFEKSGSLEKALEHFAAALDIGVLTRGPVDVQVAEYRRNVSRVHQLSGRLALAIGHSQQRLAVLESIRGPGHPSVARAFLELCELFHLKGEAALSKEYRKKGLRLLNQARKKQS